MLQRSHGRGDGRRFDRRPPLAGGSSSLTLGAARRSGEAGGQAGAALERWSRRAFRDSAVRLQLFALAYSLGNFLRSLAVPASSTKDGPTTATASGPMVLLAEIRPATAPTTLRRLYAASERRKLITDMPLLGNVDSRRTMGGECDAPLAGDGKLERRRG